MIPLEDVQAEVLRSVPVLGAVSTPLADALGLVLAEPIVATEPVPPFANTAMDGYAVRAADTEGASAEAPVRLKVVADLAGRARADRARRPGRGDPDHDRRADPRRAPTRS